MRGLELAGANAQKVTVFSRSKAQSLLAIIDTVHEVTVTFRLNTLAGIDRGQVNRLKMLKHQMYGRADLDLLRIQVL